MIIIFVVLVFFFFCFFFLAKQKESLKRWNLIFWKQIFGKSLADWAGHTTFSGQVVRFVCWCSQLFSFVFFFLFFFFIFFYLLFLLVLIHVREFYFLPNNAYWLTLFSKEKKIGGYQRHTISTYVNWKFYEQSW